MSSLGTDRYEIQSCLDATVSNEVHVGMDRATGRPLTFRTARGSAMGTRRLDREFRILAALSHPSIVRVHERFILGEDVWFAMERVDGVPTNMVVQPTGELRLEEPAAFFFEQLQAALDYIHDRHIVHADLSPDELLVDKSGVVKIVSLANCHLLDTQEPGGQATGMVGCKPSHRAPEQLKGRAMIESDYFAVGTLLYQCLTGSTPFRGPTIMADMAAIITFEPVAFLATTSGCDPELCAILRSLWSQEPSSRPAGWDLLRVAARQRCRSLDGSTGAS